MPVKNFAAILVLMLLTMVLISLAGTNTADTKPMAYKPDFEQFAIEDKVTEVTIFENPAGVDSMHVVLKDEGSEATAEDVVHVVKITLSEPVVEFIHENVPKVNYSEKSTVVSDIFWSIGPFLLVMFLVYFLFLRQMRSAGKGAMSFGKSRAKMLTRDRNKITFICTKSLCYLPRIPSKMC